MATLMTASDRDAYIATLRLLLSDKSDADIIYVLTGALPQFTVLQTYQLNNLRQGLEDLSGKAQMIRSQI